MPLTQHHSSALVAEAFEHIVATSGRYRLVHTVRSAELAYFYCARGGVDLVLMDVYTGLGADGIHAAARHTR